MPDQEDEESGKYFSLGDAAKEVGDASGAAETAGATAKLFGKTVFNIGKWALTELPAEMIKTAERQKNKQ